MRRLLLTLAAAALTACGGDDPTGPGEHVVSMRDNSFEPANLTIEQGEAVRWRNNGQFPHNSTGANSAWATGNLNPGQQALQRFNDVGTFDYSCTLHAGMTGRIVVQ